MPNAFSFTNPPFDRLTEDQRAAFANALDIVFFKTGETVIAPGSQPDHFFIVIKGAIEERDGNEVVAIRGPDDSFDSRSLVHGPHDSAFVVGEEALCYTVPRDVVLDLIRSNPAFGAFFYLEISLKLDSLAKQSEVQQVNALMTARVADAFIHPPIMIDGAESIEAAGHRMRAENTNALLVRDVGAEGERIGIVTGMNLSKGVVLRRLPLETPIKTISHFDLVTIRPTDFMFSALLLMTRHDKRRLVVTDDDGFVGILDEIDVLGFLSSNSHVVAARIDKAASLEDLRPAAQEIERTIETLHHQGVRIRVINELSSELNRKLFARVYSFVTPAALADGACLMVMGSEGRAEQALRTDQDNGLILREEISDADLAPIRERFTASLLDLGYPSCPGEVMVSNPSWSKTLDAFRDDLRRWVRTPDNEAPMNVAIFYDASAVAGDISLLREAKRTLFDLVRGNSAFHAHFAKAIDSFVTPLGMFHNLVVGHGERRDALDLKKGGIFPIVHGVRSLALEKELEETNTAQRIHRLGDYRIFEPGFAHELTEAYNFLLELQLKTKLALYRKGLPPGTLIRPGDLSTLERDLLRDALFVVKRFRELVRHHFRLSVF